MKNSTKQYELTFILGEKAGQEEATAKTAEVKAAIAKLGGTVGKEESWGRRELAYEIKRNRSGFYVTLWFEAPTDAIIPLERELRFDEAIIRFLTTVAYTEAQPGTLYPVAEEEKDAKDKERKGRSAREEKVTGEEELRRSSGPAREEKAAEAPAMDEEERLEKLDAALDELLKDDQE